MDSDPMRKDSLHVPPATLLALAARAEAGGDDALSHDVWRALGWEPFYEHGFVKGWSRPPKAPPYYGEPHFGPRPDLTKSLDAVEEVPGRIVKTYEFYHDAPRFGATAVADAANYFVQAEYDADSYTECLARLAAKLRALAAQKESGGG